MVEKELAALPARVKRLEDTGTDLSALEHPDVSGISGTSVTDTFSYFIVKWLLGRYPQQVSFNWDWFEDEYRLAETWPRFMPLLEEDADVEANVPYRDYLRAARAREREITWLLRRFDALPLSCKEKAELYDAQQLYVTWAPSYAVSRTGMRLRVRKIFYHRGPLIQRRDIDFSAELEKPSPPLTRLSQSQGQRVLDLARETSTLRYRELYGFTHGDSRRVLRTNLGRGVDLFITSVPPEKRLPLRAYHAAMIFKNGVPVGYFEGLSLFERMESGFNLYYTFREGETAWLYARTLNLFRHLLGVTAFTLDPYQIGHENEEGIESGAFWFYRKLGFRSTDPQLRMLTEREEEMIHRRAAYRTPPHVLRQLAQHPMIFELDKSRTGDWDKFQIRNVGLAVQRRMAERFGGDANSIRTGSVKSVIEALGWKKQSWREIEFSSLQDFAVMMALIPGLKRWSLAEKQLAIQIVRAKTGVTETSYLKLMQKHARLRDEVIRLGSRKR